MKRYQTGEIMLVMLAVMLVVACLGSRHMGMMGIGHGDGHAEKSGDAAQQTKVESPQPPALVK